MSQQNENTTKPKIWQVQDQRLLRAARRIIRLYDLKQAKLMTVKTESIAQIIAQELNEPDEPPDLTG